MADHELELAAKFGIPEIHGLAARLEGRYKVNWGNRSTQVLAAAAEAADLEPAELGAALEANDPASDLLWRTLNRAVEVSDPDYISALGRLIGQALDPALIDEVAYLTTELVRLEPIHLRTLISAFAFMDEGQYVDDPTTATVAAAAFAQTPHTSIGADDVSSKLQITPFAAQRAIARISTEGLVIYGSTPPDANNNLSMMSLMPTEWGGRALLLIFPRINEIWLGGDNYARRTDLGVPGPTTP